jgi:hypothetical protein
MSSDTWSTAATWPKCLLTLWIEMKSARAMR